MKQLLFLQEAHRGGIYSKESHATTAPRWSLPLRQKLIIYIVVFPAPILATRSGGMNSMSSLIRKPRDQCLASSHRPYSQCSPDLDSETKVGIKTSRTWGLNFFMGRLSIHDVPHQQKLRNDLPKKNHALSLTI